MMESKEILINSLKFKLANLAVDLKECPFEFMNSDSRMRQDIIEIGKVRARLPLDEKPTGNVSDHLAAYVDSELIDSLEQRRCLPMEANNLNLTIDTLGNRKNDLMERATGNRKLFIESTE
jgi:hypothetical protein